MPKTRFDVTEEPEVQERQEKLREAEEVREEATERLLDAQDRLEQAEEAEARGETPDVSRQELVRQIPQLKSDLRVAKSREEAAREELERAKARAVEAMEDEIKSAYAEAVREFWLKLHEAADAWDTVQEIHSEAYSLFGRRTPLGRSSPLPDVGWSELRREKTAVQQQTRIGTLRRFLEDQAPWIDLPTPNGSGR